VVAGVFEPGHRGELTRIVPFELADAELEGARARERRVRLLPSHGRGVLRARAVACSRRTAPPVIGFLIKARDVDAGALTGEGDRDGPADPAVGPVITAALPASRLEPR